MTNYEKFKRIADYIYDWDFAEDFQGTLATGISYTFFYNDELGVHMDWMMTSGGIDGDISNNRRRATAENHRQEELKKYIEEYGLDCKPSDYFVVIEDEDVADEMFGDDFISTPNEVIDVLLSDFEKFYDQYHVVGYPQHEEAYKNMILKAHEKLIKLVNDLDLETSY